MKNNQILDIQVLQHTKEVLIKYDDATYNLPCKYVYETMLGMSANEDVFPGYLIIALDFIDDDSIQLSFSDGKKSEVTSFDEFYDMAKSYRK